MLFIYFLTPSSYQPSLPPVLIRTGLAQPFILLTAYLADEYVQIKGLLPKKLFWPGSG